MITADEVRSCRGTDGAARLFRLLGYPVERVGIDPEEWRRGGIEIPWNGAGRLDLLSRLEHFDLLLLEGRAEPSEVERFLRDYSKYNVLTKSAIINCDENQAAIVVYGLSGSDLRRFRVDPLDPTRYAVDRLNLLSLDAERRADPGALFERALDRQSVSRQFFVRFRAAVNDVAAALGRQLPGESEEDRREQALLLLSRLLFLCFIQEKGWLNGERRFLIDRAARAGGDGDEFFSTVLVPLFFGCLNTPAAERDAVARELGAIPYLNGGLFEPSRFEVRHPRLTLPNELMRQVIETVFEKFDFSVDERDRAGVHVDPEMLGKVFESLMAADERAVSGSFYTPKEIVDVLATGAIVEWVSAGDEAVRERLLRLCAPGHSERSEESPSRRSFADAQDDTIVRRLEGIAILDPACGSGAFLLSALGVIEKLIAALSPDQRADLRQQIVERSLYGVDIKSEAVRLCELRLWLAIVSGASVTAESVRPLPNLDRNILQGNSLLTPLDFLGGARADIYRQWAYGLRAQQALIERYRSAPKAERPALHRLLRANDQRLATDLLGKAIQADEDELQRLVAPRRDLFGKLVEPDAQACRDLHGRIAATRKLLDRVEEGEADFFSFDVHFATVMARGGFDIVLGNPPWVRTAAIDPASRRMYRQRYRLFGNRLSGAGSAFHQPDLSTAFFERAATLTGPGGIVSVLLPAKILNAGYAAPLRAFVADELALVGLIDWTSDRRRLFSADTFPLGLIARRGRGGADETVNVTAGGEEFRVPRRELALCNTTSEWSLTPPAVGRIVRRLWERFPPLEETLGRCPVMGVKTGDNRRFFLDAQSVDRGWLYTSSGVAVPTEFVCRCVRGRDVRRWSTLASTWMLWPPAAGWHEPPPWLRQLADFGGVAPESMRLSWVRPEHVGIKVGWKDVSRGMAAVVLPDTVTVDGHSFLIVPNQTLYCLDAVSLDEAHALAAAFNSSVVDALLLAIAERAKDDHYRYFGRTVGRIPLPSLGDDEIRSTLVRCSRAGHRTRSTPAELDLAVARLYEITKSELEVLREWVAERLRAR